MNINVRFRIFVLAFCFYYYLSKGMCTACPGQRISGAANPDTAAMLQLKPKRKLMTKFFNEPVDALDLRLANAEENLSRLPVDPFTDTVKQEVSLTIHNIPCYAFRYLVFLKVYLNIHNFPCFAFIYLVFLKVFKHTEVLSNPHVCLFSLFYRFSEN